MIESSLTAIAKKLNDADVRFLVMGTLAVTAHGVMPRTGSIELGLAVDAEGTERATKYLVEMGYQWHVADSFAHDARQSRMNGAELVWMLRQTTTTDGDLGVVLHERSDFLDLYARAVRFEMGGAAIPVCAYEDLVKLKRKSNQSADKADLDQLEKVRRPRPAYDPWYASTFEGNELWDLWKWSDLSFSDKLRSLEGSLEVCRMFQGSRR